eukprot:3534344-Amphidinium_carterae.1
MQDCPDHSAAKPSNGIKAAPKDQTKFCAFGAKGGVEHKGGLFRPDRRSLIEGEGVNCPL